MAKLSYNPAWTENQQVAIEEALGLDEKQSETLFTNQEPITITKEQAQQFKDWATAEKNKPDEDEEELGGEQTNDANNDTPTTNDDRSQHDADDADKADMIDISVASQRDRDAIDVGRKLSDGTLATLRDGYEAREKVNITPLLVRQSLVADAKAKKFDLNDLPVPGSYRKGGKTVIGTGDNVRILGDNDPYDKFTFQTLNDNAKHVTKKGSYYDSMFRSTALGKELVAARELADAAVQSFKEKGPAMPSEYSGKTKPQCIRRRSLFDSRIRYGINTVKKAVELHQQCHAFDGLTQVGYSFDTELVNDKRQFVNRNEPIQVFSQVTEKLADGKERIKTGDPSNQTIGAFLRYDVAKAIALAGGNAKDVTLEHLQKTVARERGGTDQADKQNKKASDAFKTEIGNVENFETATYTYLNYLHTDQDDLNVKHVEAIKKRIAEKDGNDFLLALGDLCVHLDDGVWPIIQKAYEKAAAERNAVAIAERANKNKNLAA